jgi:hypothetical protein
MIFSGFYVEIGALKSAKPWRSSLPKRRWEQPTQRNLGTSPRENCCWLGTQGLPIAFAAQDRKGTGAGQPNTFGRGKATRKVFVPIKQSVSECASCNGTGGENGPKLAAADPDLHPATALRSQGPEPAVLRFSGRGAGSIESGRCRGRPSRSPLGTARSANRGESGTSPREKLLAVPICRMAHCRKGDARSASSLASLTWPLRAANCPTPLCRGRRRRRMRH